MIRLAGRIEPGSAAGISTGQPIFVAKSGSSPERYRTAGADADAGADVDAEPDAVDGAEAGPSVLLGVSGVTATLLATRTESLVRVESAPGIVSFAIESGATVPAGGRCPRMKVKEPKARDAPTPSMRTRCHFLEGITKKVLVKAR